MTEFQKKLTEIDNQLPEITRLENEREDLQEQLDLLEDILDKRRITIKGQTKTLREWLMETRETAGGVISEIDTQINEKEAELAEISVFLEYFDEANLAERSLRREQADKIPLNWEEISGLNPQLKRYF